MGLFGGGNSSSSTSTQSSGFSQIGGPALQVQGSGNNVRFIDPGALKAATNIALASLQQVEVAGQNSSNTVSQAVGAVSQAAQGQTNTLIDTALKWAAIVALGYFAFHAFGKR